MKHLMMLLVMSGLISACGGPRLTKGSGSCTGSDAGTPLSYSYNVFDSGQATATCTGGTTGNSVFEVPSDAVAYKLHCLAGDYTFRFDNNAGTATKGTTGAVINLTCN